MQYFGSTYILNSQGATMYLGGNKTPKDKIHIIQVKLPLLFLHLSSPNKSVHSIVHQSAMMWGARFCG